MKRGSVLTPHQTSKETRVTENDTQSEGREVRGTTTGVRQRDCTTYERGIQVRRIE